MQYIGFANNFTLAILQARRRSRRCRPLRHCNLPSHCVTVRHNGRFSAIASHPRGRDSREGWVINLCAAVFQYFLPIYCLEVYNFDQVRNLPEHTRHQTDTAKQTQIYTNKHSKTITGMQPHGIKHMHHSGSSAQHNRTLISLRRSRRRMSLPSMGLSLRSAR